MVKLKTHLQNVTRYSPMNADNRNDFLRLDMNENPNGLPVDFIKGILKRITPEYLSCYPEYSRLIEKLAKNNNLEVDNICLSNGSDSAIKYIFDAYISSGDDVLLTNPTFAMYPIYCKIAGAKFIEFPYNKDFSFSCDDFINLIDKKLKMVVIVNPNNPTGTAINQEELVKIINKCAEYSILTVIDEAYYHFYDNTVIDLIKQYKNLIVLRTFSKLCGFASLRFGYAAANPVILSNLHKVKPTFDVNGLAVFFCREIA